MTSLVIIATAAPIIPKNKERVYDKIKLTMPETKTDLRKYLLNPKFIKPIIPK